MTDQNFIVAPMCGHRPHYPFRSTSHSSLACSATLSAASVNSDEFSFCSFCGSSASFCASAPSGTSPDVKPARSSGETPASSRAALSSCIPSLRVSQSSLISSGAFSERFSNAGNTLSKFSKSPSLIESNVDSASLRSSQYASVPPPPQPARTPTANTDAIIADQIFIFPLSTRCIPEAFGPPIFPDDGFQLDADRLRRRSGLAQSESDGRSSSPVGESTTWATT